MRGRIMTIDELLKDLRGCKIDLAILAGSFEDE